MLHGIKWQEYIMIFKFFIDSLLKFIRFFQLISTYSHHQTLQNIILYKLITYILYLSINQTLIKAFVYTACKSDCTTVGFNIPGLLPIFIKIFT